MNFHSMLSPESPPHTGDIAATPAFGTRRDSDPGSSLRVSETDNDQEPESSTVNNSTVNSSVLGLGIAGAMSSFAGAAVGSADAPKGVGYPFLFLVSWIGLIDVYILEEPPGVFELVSERLVAWRESQGNEALAEIC